MRFVPLLVVLFCACASDEPRKSNALDTAPPPALKLNGEGLCEFGIFAIDVYTAALYVENPSTDAETLIQSRQRKLLSKRFCRSLSAGQLAAAFKGSFEVNAGKDLPKYQNGLDMLCAAMAEVEADDTMAFDYRPGRGIEVIVAGQPKTVIPGDDWAEMFFRLYLGERPPDENLRRALLGG